MFLQRSGNSMRNFSSVFKILIFVRLISAFLNPIDDCDEVYNFYEPVRLIINQETTTTMNLFILATQINVWKWFPNMGIFTFICTSFLCLYFNSLVTCFFDS